MRDEIYGMAIIGLAAGIYAFFALATPLASSIPADAVSENVRIAANAP